MMEPVNDTIWFAGEAAHETLWGTVGGAWESGERAAEAVLRRMGVLKTPAPGSRGRAQAQGERHARCAAPAVVIRGYAEHHAPGAVATGHYVQPRRYFDAAGASELDKVFCRVSEGCSPKAAR